VRRAALLTSIVLMAALRADGAPPAPDPTTALRADVDALVKAMTDASASTDGPSPTARVNRLVAAGDARLRPVLEGAWRIVTTSADGRPYAAATKSLIRFLYPTAESAKSPTSASVTLVDEDGIVRIRRADAASSDDSTPAFAALLKGAWLRRPSKPDLKKTLEALDAGAVPDGEISDVAKAVGETCGGNKRATADLLARFDAAESVAWPATALAWSSSPDAEPRLRDRVASFALRASKPDAAAAAVLAGACRALEHVRRDALVDEIGKLSGAPRDAAVAAAGGDVAMRVDLAAAADGGEPSARNAALAAVCRRIVDARGALRISAATSTELARLFASRVDGVDAPLRASVLAAAERWFFGAVRASTADAATGLAPAAADAKPSVELVGAYPDMAKALASIANDLAAGDLVFADDEEPSLFDVVAAKPTVEWARLQSDVRSPNPMDGVPPGADGAPPPTVQLRGEVYGQWLRLTLTNVGPTAITVNPTAMRYATAEYGVHEIYGGPAGGRTYRRLKLTLGAVRASVATPAFRLRTLAPNERLPWVIDLRHEDRAIDHVSVELYPTFVVRGAPAAPPLMGFSETWVK
jgi:hypothetical protein